MEGKTEERIAGEKKRDVLGPLLTKLGETVYKSTLVDMLGTPKNKKITVVDRQGLTILNRALNKSVKANIVRQASPLYWARMARLWHQIDWHRESRVKTYQSTPGALLEEGLSTGITMPINLLDRLSKSETGSEEIANEFDGDISLWGAATLLRPDTRASLHRIAYGRNGSLGNPSFTVGPWDRLAVESTTDQWFVEYDPDRNIIVPDKVRKELRRGATVAGSTGCPVRHTRFSPEGSNYSLIDLGIEVVAMTLLDTSMSWKGRLMQYQQEL